MNAESNAILQVMICETKHEIQGGGNHPPLGSRCHKKSLVARGLIKPVLGLAPPHDRAVSVVYKNVVAAKGRSLRSHRMNLVLLRGLPMKRFI